MALAAAGEAALALVRTSKKKEEESLETYVVSSTGKDADEVVVKILKGDYIENGTNHERKIYKKSRTGSETVDVFLYYWDDRDGEELQGWYFGKEVGGDTVWSHNAASAEKPPAGGWKIPWDGEVRDTLKVATRAEMMKSAAKSKIKSVGGATSKLISTAKADFEKAKEAAGDHTSSEGLKVAEALLAPQLTALAEAMKSLTDAQQGGTPEIKKQAQQQRGAAAVLVSSINLELGKIRSAVKRAEQNDKERLADERDLAVLEEALGESRQKANAAEDAVEAAYITSELINGAGEDMEEAKLAVAQTETAVQEAQKVMGEARIFLNAKSSICKRLESVNVQSKAAQDFVALQKQLMEAQDKLNGLKNVRQDFVQRQAMQKVLEEVEAKLIAAEVDVDGVEEATSQLTSKGPTKETVLEAQQALEKSSEHLTAFLEFLESKKETATTQDAREQFEKLEERANDAQARLTQLEKKQKEATEQIDFEAMLKEGAEKLQAVAESVARATEVESEFNSAVETATLAENTAAVMTLEASASSANTAAAIARMFLGVQTFAVKRFVDYHLSEEAQRKVAAFKADLESYQSKLFDVNKAIVERKRNLTSREFERVIKKAEELADQVAEAATPLEDDDKLQDLTSQEIRSASEETVQAERLAFKHLADARKLVFDKKKELEGREAAEELSSDLFKYDQRLQDAQNKTNMYKTLATTVENRLAAKSAIGDANSKLAAVDEKLEKIAMLVKEVQAPAPVEEELALEVAQAAEETPPEPEGPGALELLLAAGLGDAEDEAEGEGEGESGAVAREAAAADEKATVTELLEKIEETATQPSEAPAEEARGEANVESEVPKSKVETQAQKEHKEKVLAAAKNAQEEASEAQASIQAASRFIDMMLRVQQGSARVQLQEMRPRIADMQKTLDAQMSVLREPADRATVETICKETEECISKVEEAVKKAGEAQQPFQAEGEQPAEKVAELLEALEAAVQGADKELGEARKHVGIKRAAVRPLTQAPRKDAEENLTKADGQLSELMKLLQDSRNILQERKRARIKRKLEDKVEAADQKVEDSQKVAAVVETMCQPPAKVTKTAETEDGVAEGSEGQDGAPEETDGAPGESEEGTAKAEESGTAKPEESGTAKPGESDEKNVKKGEEQPTASETKQPSACEMKEACEKARAMQREAKVSISTARKVLETWQRDSSTEAPLVAEATKLLERLGRTVDVLDRQKALLREQEDRFVAERLLKDAIDQVEKLEQILEGTSSKAAPLSDEGRMAAIVCLTYVVEKLKRELKRDSKTPKELFEEMSFGMSALEEGAFVCKLLEVDEDDPEDVPFSEMQLRAAFERMTGSKDSNELDAARFMEEFRSRYICAAPVVMTEGLVIKGGKTIRRVHSNEILEALGEPEKEESLGLLRLKVKAEKDGVQGFVTVASNTGKVYLEPYSQQTALQKNLEYDFKMLQDACRDATKHLDRRMEQLHAIKLGPLAELKSDLLQLKPRVAKVQIGIQELRKKMTQVEKRQKSIMEEPKKRRQAEAKMADARRLAEEAAAKRAVEEAEAEEAKRLSQEADLQMLADEEAAAEASGAAVEDDTAPPSGAAACADTEALLTVETATADENATEAILADEVAAADDETADALAVTAAEAEVGDASDALADEVAAVDAQVAAALGTVESADQDGEGGASTALADEVEAADAEVAAALGAVESADQDGEGGASTALADEVEAADTEVAAALGMVESGAQEGEGDTSATVAAEVAAADAEVAAAQGTIESAAQDDDTARGMDVEVAAADAEVATASGVVESTPDDDTAATTAAPEGLPLDETAAAAQAEEAAKVAAEAVAEVQPAAVPMEEDATSSKVASEESKGEVAAAAAEDDVSLMKVVDLKAELKARGLRTSGNKAELMERLREARREAGAA
eukprot:TRINITY_DN4816_c0_g1_i1.p1 TRINITY_DN4816_c0_g1~~TRINITY_DN4816_c0_g1_i1.p1  ORF type:complete len:1912 (+),score=720.91 TRINITY_DN4816_c0_g1_i1:76-5811(+)